MGKGGDTVEAMNQGGSNQNIIYLAEKHLTQLRIDDWLQHDLFTWQWWVLVVLLILPWFLWWRYTDKKRLQEIFIVGLLVFIFSAYLDAVLSELGLWHYHYWVLPVWPRLIAADFAIIPVCYMLVYQKYRSWPSYTVALAIMAFILAVPTEIIMIWADVFEMHGWKHIYGVPIFFAMGILVRWIAQTLVKKQAQAF
ncbi:MAG: CBO0543 family protein [Syntrophomonadaceae bacterium]